MNWKAKGLFKLVVESINCGVKIDFRILKLDQFGKPVGPQRVWLKNERAPGLAMSRSFGDLGFC